jgi:CheY-like chemotaxis protein
MEEELLKGKVLLVVDDEEDLREIVASELEYMGAKVIQAENIANAQEVLNHTNIDLIISDIRMPGGTGVDLLDVIKLKRVDCPPVILITGFADITVEDAFNKGAEALINKPFKLDDLIKMVVRYTSPFSERFNEEGEAKKIVHAVDSEKIKFGRGGVAMEITTNGLRYEVGDLVNFDFEYKDQHYQGSGICRWFKSVDNSLTEAIIGLEFMSLNKTTLQNFQNLNNGKKIVPYIPASF